MDDDRGYCMSTGNCWLLSCRYLDDTCFVCNLDNELRLQVKRLGRREKFSLPLDGIYGLTEDEIFIFETIGYPSVDKADILEAINWYKIYITEPDMRIVDLKN